MPSFRAGCRCLPAPLLPTPTFPGEQVAGTAGAREDRSISAGRLPGTAAAGPRGEGQGAVRAALSTLVTASGLAPRGRVPEKEEGWTGQSSPREEGREKRGRAAVCRPPIWTGSPGAGRVWRACGAGARACGPGVPVASVGARHGDAVALAEGAGPAHGGAGRGRQGPRRARSGFPAASPPPHRKFGVGAGAGGGVGASSTQSFQRHFQWVGRHPLHGGAGMEGRGD